MSIRCCICITSELARRMVSSSSSICSRSRLSSSSGKEIAICGGLELSNGCSCTPDLFTQKHRKLSRRINPARSPDRAEKVDSLIIYQHIVLPRIHQLPRLPLALPPLYVHSQPLRKPHQSLILPLQAPEHLVALVPRFVQRLDSL